MPDVRGLLLGESTRSIDERFRISIPAELVELLDRDGRCILAKERPGCLSLWSAAEWKCKLDVSVELVRTKLEAGKLEGRFEEVQRLGRLLSTRHREAELAGRGRLLIPEGFREFLNVDAGGEVVIVGAAICLEIWHPTRWREYLEEQMLEFRGLLDRLSS
jgi:MraZ protein